MHSRLSTVAIMAAILFAVSALLPASGRAAASDLETLGQGGAAFTLNLYRQLAAQKEGNIFFSPYSISLALAMTYAGAKGETAAQMAQVLGFTLPSARLHPALAALSRHLQKVGNEAGQTLSVANAIWLNSGLKVQPEYLQLIGDNYSKEMRQLDFCQGPQAQKTINDWVSQKTQDRIKDLIPDGVLNCHTMMVLTNAVYFLGEWADKFDQKQTKPGPFWPTPDKQVEVPFMHRTGKYFYTEAEGWQVLKLPYRGERLSMLALLPKTKGALAQEEKGLNPEMLAKLAQNLRPRQVEVILPKFEVKAGYSLNGYLKGLGMSAAFSPQADFGGISAQRQLRIDLVLHQAWVKVEEKGTEAAAGTAVVMVETAVLKPIPPPVFQADHPFLFFIQDRETGLILFWGRLSNPQAG
ncbi:MAG: serpin family protein [Desulfobaccales bacterium]